VDLADRSDLHNPAVGVCVVDTAIDTKSGLVFTSRAFDKNINLYELTSQGHYATLSQYWTRASYAVDRTRGQLLMPGRRQHLIVEGNHLMNNDWLQVCSNPSPTTMEVSPIQTENVTRSHSTAGSGNAVTALESELSIFVTATDPRCQPAADANKQMDLVHIGGKGKQQIDARIGYLKCDAIVITVS